MNESICAFTGHRPTKLPWKSDSASPQLAAFRETMTAQISGLAERGIVNFFSGMAEGTDVICSEIVLALREKNPAIKLHCALPFVGQADKWAASSRERYHAILAEADSVIYVSRKYYKNCYLDRNRFMVNHASVLFAVYNGEYRGGTAMTVRYARKIGRELFIMDPTTLRIVLEDAKPVDLGL